MPAIYIRDVPEEEVRALKVSAAKAGLTFSAYCRKVLREYEYVAEESPVEQPTEAVERITG
jgi:plasmid stability protein